MKNATERINWFSWVVVLMMFIALLITRSNSYELIVVDLFAFALLITLAAVIAILASINEENTIDDAVTLIRKADRAMYNGAKQQGRIRLHHLAR
ncbi:hypothetical protein AB3N04_15885 [Alkalihalophilus sp. As8PL]|uniref:Uncharacterized protein n=1 Tax=Alkalihalophilus sp. As8PL TaxID=3237103 RepID=A0AB39BR25_9BACI